MDLAHSIVLSLCSIGGCLGSVSGLLALARVRAVEPRVRSLEERASELEPLGRLAAVLGETRFDGAEEQPKSARVGSISDR